MAYTAEDLLSIMRHVAEEYGGPISVKRWRELGIHPTPLIFIKKFGSWNGAWRAAGYDKKPSNRSSYSKMDYKQALREAYEKHGRMLSPSEWKALGYKPSISSIYIQVGTWREAWASIGVYRSLTKEKAIEIMVTAFKANNDMPIPSHKWKNEYGCSVTAIKKLFDSWNNAWNEVLASLDIPVERERAIIVTGKTRARVMKLDPEDMLASAKTDKEREMVRRFLLGQTFRELSKTFGLTHQRAQQIINSVYRRAVKRHGDPGNPLPEALIEEAN